MASVRTERVRGNRSRLGTEGQMSDTPTESSGLRMESCFCPDEVQDPFDTVQWDLRTAAIKDENGDVLFEQRDCEAPTFWSQLAVNVVVSEPDCKAPCTAPDAPPSLCISMTTGMVPQMFFCPLAENSSAHSPMFDDGVMG